MIAKDLKLLVTMLRTEGPIAVIRRLAFRFFHVHTFNVYRLRLTGALPVPVPAADVELREATQDQVRALRSGRTDLPEYFYRDESEVLERCWVGLEQGRLGFIAWVSLHGSSGMVRVGEQEAELAYIYNLESMRGKRLTSRAVALIARTLYDEGYTALLAVPHSGNPAIIKSFLACGFRQIGSIRRYGFVTWPRAPVDVSAWPDPAPTAS